MSPATSRRLTIALWPLAALLCCAGCNNLAVKTDRTEVADLEGRALRLLRTAAASEIDIVRCNAIEALVELAAEESRPEFRAALDAPSPLVRFAGCLAVGKLRDRGAQSAVNRLLRDSDPRVKLGAAFAAVRLGNQQEGRTLVAALSDSPDENVRSDAAYLIGQLGEKRARPWLDRALRQEKTLRVRVHVFAAIAISGDRDAIDALIAFIGTDAQSRVIALQSLVEVASPRARDALLVHVRNKDEFLETRLIAARALGKLGEREGYDLARQNLNASFNDAQDANRTFRVRTLSALALGAIGDPAALPALRSLAESEADQRVQVAAACAIVQITRKRGGLF